MHSSQMYTPGPAISFLTWRWDLPQKLHSSCSLESVGRAIVPNSMLRDHAIDDAVLGRFRRAHEVIAFGVRLDLLDGLAGVQRDDLVEAAAHVDDLPRMDLDVGRLPLEARADLVDQDLRVRQRH